MRTTCGWLWDAVQRYRSFLLVLLDSCATAAAFLAALLAQGAPPSASLTRATALAMSVLVGTRALAILAGRLHCWSFYMSGLPEALRLVWAMLAGSVLCLATTTVLAPGELHWFVLVLEFFFATTLVAAMRFGPRVVLGWWGERVRGRTGAGRTIIVGAGGTAEMLARDLSRSAKSPYYVVGFVDEHLHSRGMRLAGKPVLGALRELPELIRRHAITVVLLAIPQFPARKVRELLGICDRSRVRFKLIPGSFLNVDQRVSAAMLHDLSPADLLPREEATFDEEELRRLVAGRTALVTGAGGSIGGEVCQQLARFGVGRLVMVDLNENELYLRSRELERWAGVEICVEVADVREAAPLLRLGQRYRPDYVLHAAAHKHVPLMERAPHEAVKNNVFGTLNAAQMASACGAERFVLISTDKAVNPTSVMGASKRIAEMAVRDLGRGSKTRMVAVRFGNVLGSAGSVVPLFRQQIARGGPVTVTHPECTRYFMTIPEAVGLVLLAGLGDYGELCVLEMGEPIRIADLAKHFITMSGYVPDEDIPIVYTGLRAGEKLHEELLTEQEEETMTVRNRIRVARGSVLPRDFRARLASLRLVASGGDREAVLSALSRLVPTYRMPTSARGAADRATGARNVMRDAPEAQEGRGSGQGAADNLGEGAAAPAGVT